TCVALGALAEETSDPLTHRAEHRLSAPGTGLVESVAAGVALAAVVRAFTPVVTRGCRPAVAPLTVATRPLFAPEVALVGAFPFEAAIVFRIRGSDGVA